MMDGSNFLSSIILEWTLSANLKIKIENVGMNQNLKAAIRNFESKDCNIKLVTKMRFLLLEWNNNW